MQPYLKCVIANKGALIGYALIITGIISIPMYFFGKLSEEIIVFLIYCGTIGFMALAMAQFGFRTLFYYKRVHEHFKKHGFLDNRFMEEFECKDYCVKVGARLAEKEIKSSH